MRMLGELSQNMIFQKITQYHFLRILFSFFQNLRQNPVNKKQSSIIIYFFIIKTLTQNKIRFELKDLIIFILKFKFYSLMINQNIPQTTLEISQNQKSNINHLAQELNTLKQYCPALGIYILPNIDQPNIWNGIIFVRHGYYKQGTFKFNLHLDQYPQKLPKLYFITKIYHPLVDYQTGELDINAILSDIFDQSNQNILYYLMNQLNQIFIQKQKINNPYSYNPKAAQLYQKNKTDFILKAMRCVDQANEQLKHNKSNSSINTVQIEQNEKALLKQMLKEACSQDGSIIQKVKYLIDQIMQE